MSKEFLLKALKRAAIRFAITLASFAALVGFVIGWKEGGPAVQTALALLALFLIIFSFEFVSYEKSPPEPPLRSPNDPPTPSNK